MKVSESGKVTSGSPAPFLKKNIGFAYVPVEYASAGQEIQIDVRGRLVGAQIVKAPFLQETKVDKITDRMEDPWRTFRKTCTTAKIMNG